MQEVSATEHWSSLVRWTSLDGALEPWSSLVRWTSHDQDVEQKNELCIEATTENLNFALMAIQSWKD